MGLDGFSMGNLGLNTDMTSAQMASQAEQLAKKESEFKIKDVSELTEQNSITRREERSRGKDQFGGYSKKKKDNDDEKQSVLSEKDFENKDPREFAVRINPETELIELFNTKNEKILETITAKDLMSLISKLNNASGVLVNKRI